MDESGFIATAAKDGSKAFPSDTVIALYDTFQLLTEQLIGHATLLMISYGSEGLRLAADTDIDINTGSAPLPVSLEQQDDILFMTINAIPVDKRHKRVTTAAQEKQPEQKGGE